MLSIGALKPPDQRDNWPARRLLPVWVVVLAGLAVSLGAFLLARKQELIAAETGFIHRAEIHHAALQASIHRHLESLRGVQRLMQLSTNVDLPLFARFAADIVAEQPEIQVIEWCPRVPAPERLQHEAYGRAQGFPTYQIVERDAARRAIPAGQRAEYFPILFFEPVRGNEVVQGFDVAVGKAAAELAQARDTGAPTASSRVRMVQDIGPQFGLILTLPVYEPGAAVSTVEERRRAFIGCVRGVFRVRDLLEAAWKTVPVVDMDTLLLDSSTTKADERMILYRPSALREEPSPEASEDEMLAGRFHQSTLRVAGRTWTCLFRPTPEWWATQFSWLPWFILAGGLGATVVSGSYVRSWRRRAEVVEETVAARTAELRAANDTLRQTQNTLVLAQRVGRVGSWAVDLTTDSLSWSEETFRIFGQDPATFRPNNDSFFAAVPPADRERVHAAVRTALEHGLRYDVEHRIVRPDGVECVVHEMAEIERDAEDKPLRMVGTVQDITERHYAEERIEWERNLLRTVVDSLPDYIFIKDREGRFVLNNRANLAMLGVKSQEECAGKTDADFLPGEVAALYAAADRAVMDTGEPVISQEEPLVMPNGERRCLLTTKIPLKDGRGNVTGLVGICRDITGRKQAEEERQTMERKFQETQKLESLGVLAGGISHDFNNLLTGILGNASLARMELPAESALHSYLQQIEVSSQRAAELCKQMLAYSGKGRFVIQSIDVSALVRETVHLLQLSISKKAVLKLQLAEKLPPIMADATQIRQIIMNLVMNASDAIGEKSGLITITTSVCRADKRYLIDLVGAPDLNAGTFVTLEVSDNGCGMSEQTQARIFEPFFTTRFTGRGLGLAAVLGIVRGHKGALKVYSEPGRGSTFKLLLPASAAPSGDMRPDKRPAQQWRGSGTVLVIDDEESVRMVAARLGFEVLTANDGEQGAQIYRVHHDSITAVLLDLTMPKMDGDETFREIRRIHPGACVILMSGFNEQEAAARFVGKGLAGFLQKPFTPEELRERLAAFAQGGAATRAETSPA
jgi:PAS domain S-box-containing protein